MEINLKNKTACVFGGSGGIGKAIAIELSKAGANILLIGRNSLRLNRALDELFKQNGQTHDCVVIDMGRSDDLLSAFKSYPNLKSIDIIINNSGGPPSGPAHLAETDEYIAAFKQHLIAAQTVLKLTVQFMKQNNFGRIINIVSTSVKQPIPGLGVSNTIRGAVANWSKTLSLELAPFGITVNNILPGATKTGRLTEIINNKANKSNSSLEEVEKEMKEVIPIGRFAEPKEIAYTALFLSSDYAAYITGINVPVDGGRTRCL